MDDQGGSSSAKKKKKRGSSLIFRYLSRKSSHHDPVVDQDKVLASDDNLVYCDVTTNSNRVDSDPSIKKSSSSHHGHQGRMSKIFKAVLFDTAMKTKMSGKKSKKVSASAGSSPIPYDYPMNDYPSIEDSFNENMLISSNFDKFADTREFSNPDDRSSQIPLSPKTTQTAPPASPIAATIASPTVATIASPTAATTGTTPFAAIAPSAAIAAPAPSTAAATTDNVAPPPLTASSSPRAVSSPPRATSPPPPATSSPTATTTMNPPAVSQTEPKLPARMDSMKKKPPLPPYSRVESMKKKPTINPPTTRERKPAQVSNPKSRLLPLIIVLGLFVMVVLWTFYAAKTTEPSEIDKSPYTDIVTTGDEL